MKYVITSLDFRFIPIWGLLDLHHCYGFLKGLISGDVSCQEVWEKGQHQQEPRTEGG